MDIDKYLRSIEEKEFFNNTDDDYDDDYDSYSDDEDEDKDDIDYY